MVKPSALEGYSVPEVWATVARSEADASVCLWKDETTKAKDCPMTPTAQIAAIRQRAEKAYPRGVSDIRHDGTPVYTQMGDPVADVRSLLQQIDARESALRALVAQFRDVAATRGQWESEGIHECADAVERLLESEQ